MRQLALGVRLRAAAVFDNFAAGQNTELLAALRGGTAAPVWLWGGPATGKTHLLQAVCAAAQRVGSTAGDGSLEGAAYFPLDRALRLPPDALRGFEYARVLCVDDADAVAGEPVWERSLFQLFNDAAELNTRLVFAAGAAPRALPWSLEDWGSRAASCVVYQVHDLDEAGRGEALRKRAAQRGLALPQDTVEYLLRRLPRDLPSLFDVLDQLDEASLVEQRRLTVPFIRAALERHASTKP